MRIEKSLEMLKDYANNYAVPHDEEFIEFANNLNNFANNYKNKFNINDPQIFINLIKDSIDFKDEHSIKMGLSSISLIEECYQKDFVDYPRFHNNFREYSLNAKLKIEQQLEDELIKTLQETAIYNETVQNKKQEIIKLKELDSDFKEPEIINLKNNNAPNVSQMLNFIKDKSQIHYPFSSDDTFNNKFFMKDLNKELRKINTQEIQKMIDLLKQKNEQLRQEIKELDEQKINLVKELKKELIDNQKLSVLNEINQQEITTNDNQKQYKKVKK